MPQLYGVYVYDRCVYVGERFHAHECGHAHQDADERPCADDAYVEDGECVHVRGDPVTWWHVHLEQVMYHESVKGTVSGRGTE